ncbi:MBL fold metallo-hydrolase [Kribbella sp. NPDC050124]|uniref:MBL fold metallo-hydrolase n=1 Tax=Kribbella sp. NPDC050124 TaxID=3364114 RepID=UPI0037894EEA
MTTSPKNEEKRFLMIDFSDGAAGPGSLDVSWHAGWPSAKHDPAPEIQVHAYDPHTVILRQNKSVSHEAPFMFLLFGNSQAVLLDTGATSDPAYFPLRRTVDALIADWLADNPRDDYGLTIAHTHGHDDHVAGDGQFAGRQGTTVLGRSLDDVIAFYGLRRWPGGAATLDLGGRVLDVLPGPGHHKAAIVFYDRYTGLLFSGDSLYRGRLYVEDWSAFRATIDRLLDFCATRPVSHILGCHIEMTTTPGKDYLIGSTYQPDEPPLQLTVDHLRALRELLNKADDRPGSPPFGDIDTYKDNDFIVWRF